MAQQEQQYAGELMEKKMNGGEGRAATHFEEECRGYILLLRGISRISTDL